MIMYGTTARFQYQPLKFLADLISFKAILFFSPIFITGPILFIESYVILAHYLTVEFLLRSYLFAMLHLTASFR